MMSCGKIHLCFYFIHSILSIFLNSITNICFFEIITFANILILGIIKIMFKENFACIKNNKRLQEDLIKISIESATENLAMAKANNGDTIFIKNNFPLDDTENPTQYAKNLVNDKLKSLSFTDKIFVKIGRAH